MSNPTPRKTSTTSTTSTTDTTANDTVRAKALDALRKACEVADGRALKLTADIVKAYLGG